MIFQVDVLATYLVDEELTTNSITTSKLSVLTKSPEFLILRIGPLQFYK